MVHKRYIKKKGKTYGPYYYKNVRDKDGSVKSIYLGNSLKQEKNHVVQHKILYVLLSLIFILAVLSGFYFSEYTGHSVNLGEVPLNEFENQNISQGDYFSVKLISSLRAAYFTDDSDLFEITPEGFIEFEAEERGEYPVAIIAKNEEGFEYKVVKVLIR